MIAVNLFTRLAWTWYVLLGTVICVVIGTAVSLLVRLKPDLLEYVRSVRLQPDRTRE